MRILLIGMFSFVVFHGLQSQNIERHGYTNGGGYSALTNKHVSYSIGQPVCQTQRGNLHSFTQGYQQPVFQTSVHTTNPSWQGSMTAFPNPTMDVFSIEIKSLGITEGKVLIKNSLNQVVATKHISAANYYLLPFDATQFKSGVYFINLISRDGETLFNQKMIIQL